MADPSDIDAFHLDRPEEIPAVRLDYPQALLLPQRADHGRMGPLQDPDDFPGEPVLVLLSRDPRDDAVPRHRIAGGVGRDEHVIVHAVLLGRDEPVPAGIGPEGACDLVGDLRQFDEIARPDDHAALRAE